jgi:hypothetical protein
LSKIWSSSISSWLSRLTQQQGFFIPFFISFCFFFCFTFLSATEVLQQIRRFWVLYMWLVCTIECNICVWAGSMIALT